MCLNLPQFRFLRVVLRLLLAVLWCSAPFCHCEALLRNATYVPYNLSAVCPQLGGAPADLDYSENDVIQPEPKLHTINLGLGTAALLSDSLNSSVFQNQRPDSFGIDCVFQVTTGPESRGLFVVLSQLSALRRFHNGSCRDYLRFSFANFSSAFLCGPVGLPGQSILSFDSSVGVVRVHLHLDNQNREGIDRGEKEFVYRLQLVLTSYFDCAKERNGFSCTTTNERCIPPEYVRDGIVNCDVPSCRDEVSCLSRDRGAEQEQEMYNNLSITILIGLVSFVSTGLLFGLLLWFCLKRNFKQRMTATTSSPNLDMELSDVYSTPQQGVSQGRGSGRRRQMSAMNEQEAGGSRMGDGGGGGGGSVDPPPSYDSLFTNK